MSSLGGMKSQKLGEINEQFFIELLLGWEDNELGKRVIRFLLPNLRYGIIKSVRASKVKAIKGIHGTPKTDIRVDISTNDNKYRFNVSLKSTQLTGTLAHICRHKVSIYEENLKLSQMTANSLRKIVGENGFTPEDFLKREELSKEEYLKLTPKRRGHKTGDPFHSFCFKDLVEIEKIKLLSELESKKDELLKFAFLGKDQANQIDSIFISFWNPKVFEKASLDNLNVLFGLSRSDCINYFSTKQIKPSSTGSSLSLGELIIKKTRTHGSNPTELQVQWSYKYKNLKDSEFVEKIYPPS